MSKYKFDKIKDDIKRKALKDMMSGKIMAPKESERSVKVFPDKAYDPDMMYRQRDMDDGKSKMAQRIEDVVDSEKTYPDKEKGDKYRELRNYLKTMSQK